MKKLLTLLVAYLLLQGTASAQALMFETALPHRGAGPNLGLRANMFQPIDERVEVGFTIRAHRYVFDVRDENQGEVVNEISIGLGLRYHIFRDANTGSGLYVNPNAELVAFDFESGGIDMSFNVGYGMVLSRALTMHLEAGPRARLFGYTDSRALGNRLQFAIAAGMGFNLNRIFGTSSQGDPLLRN